MPKNIIVQQYANNIGGLNTEAEIINYPLDSSPYMLDARVLIDGTIEKKSGDSYLGTQHTDGSVGYRYIGQFEQSDGTKKNVTVAGTKISSLNLSTGALTTLTTGLTDSNDRLYDDTIYDNKSILTELNENAVIWDGNFSSYTPVQDIYGATAITGTVTFAASTAVTGAGTSFTTEISAGDWISKAGGVDATDWVQVSTVTDNTHLVLKEAYSGTAGAGALGGSTVSANFGKAKFCESFNNMAILGHVNRDGLQRNVFWYSNINQPYYFPSTFFEIIRDSQEIQGMFVLGDYLYVVTDNKLLKYTFTGDSTTPLVRDEIEYEGGCSGYSIQIVYSQSLLSYVATWINKNGIQVFDGAKIVNVTDGRTKNTIKKINNIRTNKLTSMKNTEFGEVWFFVPTGANSTNNNIIIWNYLLNIVYEFNGDFNFGKELDFDSDGIIPLTGDYDGKLSKQNQSGESNAALNTFIYRTPFYPMDNPNTYKAFRKIMVRGKASQDGLISLYYRLGGDNGFSSDWIQANDLVFKANVPTWAGFNSGTEDVIKWGDGTVWTAGSELLQDKGGFYPNTTNYMQLEYRDSTAGKTIKLASWSLFAKPKRGYRGVV